MAFKISPNKKINKWFEAPSYSFETHCTQNVSMRGSRGGESGGGGGPHPPPLEFAKLNIADITENEKK